MRTLLTITTLTVVLALGFTQAAFAANSANHTVTVTVSAINEASISGGNLTLAINAATAGSAPTDASDSTTNDLLWTTNEATKKITVATSLVSPVFTLKVQALNVTGGTAAAQQTVSNTAANFVTSISKTTGSCDLSYVASATAAQGTGSDAHTITYTLVAGP